MDNFLDTFQELKIKGRKGDLERFFKDLTSDLGSKGWKRNMDEEEKYNKSPSFDFDHIVISPPPQGDLRVKIMLFSPSEKLDEYEITNIIPLNRPSLDYDEYNMILNEFYNLFIKDKYGKYNLDVDLSDPRISLDEYLSNDSIKLLKDFSRLANKQTGSAYPSDRERWNKFVLNVFKEGEELPPDILERWLIEVGGWGKYSTRELVNEFEYGMNLLKQYKDRAAKEVVAAKS